MQSSKSQLGKKMLLKVYFDHLNLQNFNFLLNWPRPLMCKVHLQIVGRQMTKQSKSVQLPQSKSLSLLCNFLCFLKLHFSADKISLEKATEYYFDYRFIWTYGKKNIINHYKVHFPVIHTMLEQKSCMLKSWKKKKCKISWGGLS